MKEIYKSIGGLACSIAVRQPQNLEGVDPFLRWEAAAASFLLGSNVFRLSREGWGRILDLLDILNEWLAQSLHYCEWNKEGQIRWIEDGSEVRMLSIFEGEN